MKRICLALSLTLLMLLTLVEGVAAEGSAVTVTLAPQNNSGVSGTATLTPMGQQTQVVVTVTGEPAGASEPEHIHVGSCPNVGAVKFPLNPVVNGTATTLVDVPLATLTAGTFAINLHQSAAQIKVYIACGDITATAAASTSQATPKAAPATGAGGLQSGSPAAPLAIVMATGFLLTGWLGRRRAV